MRFIGLVFLGLSCWLSTVSCQGRNLYETIQFYGGNIYLEYASSVGLNETLMDTGVDLTVFAPTDNAFDGVPSEILQEWKNDPNLLKQVIQYHVTRGTNVAGTNNALFESLAGQTVRFNIYSSTNESTASGSPVILIREALNGWVCMLDRVMYPIPTESALDLVNGIEFNYLFLALAKASMTSQLNVQGITVLAPDDEAFQRLPDGVLADLLNDIPALTKMLGNHIITSDVWYSAGLTNFTLITLSGQTFPVSVTDKQIKIGTSTIITADISVTNGVVHVIDTVLFSP